MTATELVDYERIFVDGLNRGDVSAADEAFDPDCVVHITGSIEPVRGLAAWKAMLGAVLAAFPDLHFTIDDQIVDGERVAMRWQARGTHRGAFGPIAPTGRRVTIDGVIFDRVENGKVVERWEQWNQPALLEQLVVQ